MLKTSALSFYVWRCGQRGAVHREVRRLASTASGNICENVRSRVSEFPVSTFGFLRLRTFDCSPKIVGLPATEQTKVLVHHCEKCQIVVNALEEEYDVPTSSQNSSSSPDVIDKKVLNLSCSNSEHDQYCSCLVQVPVNIGLDISASGDADVRLADLEPSSCHISTEYSLIHLHRIRTKKAEVFANNGSVEVTGGLAGDITIKAGIDGFVRADRIQGNHIQIDAFSGPIDCKAIYGEKVQLSTRDGNINIGNLQGEKMKIWSSEGNVQIGSMEGDMVANLGKGSLAVNLSQAAALKGTLMEGSCKIGVQSAANVKAEGAQVIAEGFENNQNSSVQRFGEPEASRLEFSSGKQRNQKDGNLLDNPVCTVDISAPKGQVLIRKTSWQEALLGPASASRQQRSDQ